MKCKFPVDGCDCGKKAVVIVTDGENFVPLCVLHEGVANLSLLEDCEVVELFDDSGVSIVLDTKPVGKMAANTQSTLKRCWKCKQRLPLSEFYKNRTKNDGLATECKDCRMDLENARRNKNRDVHGSYAFYL